MTTIQIKRRRRFRTFRTWLSDNNSDCGMCERCQEFAEQAEAERPGHVWTVDDGKLVFMEDIIMAHKIGRKLTIHEQVVHKNNNPLDNRSENLELIVIDDLEAN